MRRLIVAIGLLLSLSILNTAQASIIRYNIIAGVDTEGYNLSGFVDINSDIVLLGYADEISAYSRFEYQIEHFLFATPAGVSYGDSGEFQGMCQYGCTGQSPIAMNTVIFYNDYITNFVGKDTVSVWHNGDGGAGFIGVDRTFEAYSVLPEQISIFPWIMRGGGMGGGYNYWGPTGTFVLERASFPVPEPATMLLLASGLLGLAGFRRKFKQ